MPSYGEFKYGDEAESHDPHAVLLVSVASGVWKIQPCQTYGTIANFPPELPRKCIRFFSYIGDIVLDPFSGYGTTCLEAKLSGRKYVGFEISPTYWKKSLGYLSQECLIKKVPV